MKAISGLALHFAPYDLPPPTSCPPSHPLSSVRMSLPVLPILRILRFYVLSSEDKRACARSIAGVLRCVDRNWREACDDDLVWLQLCSSIWVRTTLEWTGCNPAELDNIKNQHFSKHFVGFGIGRQYLTSEEAKVAEKKMMTVKKQIRTAAAKLVSVADGAGGGHELRKWLPTRHGSEDKSARVCLWKECFIRMWTEPATCFQCNAPFKEADNTSSSCQHHTRGGGCFFAFDEFIGVSFTCCNKNEPHAGCKLSFHSREEGRFAPHNAKRSWSTAHM